MAASKTLQSTASASSYLDEIAELLKLKGENPFKIRAFEKASNQLGALAEDFDLVAVAQAGELKKIEGIGAGIAQTLTEFLLQGSTRERDELRGSIDPALLELVQIPGLGPKKAQTLIDELGVKTWGELEYACRENRLIKIKGFGEKAQAKILEGVLFLKTTQGQRRLGDVFGAAEELFGLLARTLKEGRWPAGLSPRISETGDLRRRLEVLKSLDFLVEVPPIDGESSQVRERLDAVVDQWKNTTGASVGLPVKIIETTPASYVKKLVETTSTPEHWKALEKHDSRISARDFGFGLPNEEEFYSQIGLPWLPPETRETGREVSWAKDGHLDELLPWGGIRGVFHNHTTASDGLNSLEEMADAALELGYEYLGISDHSQSAFYAQGLKNDALRAQKSEVDRIQKKFPKLKIFWGIESDILADGSLDYSDEILSQFDYVVASVHSRFGHDRETMTRRLLEAIKNPHTTFIGHLTGRVLLGRPGFDADIPLIIRECARFGVGLEINANPQRLDIDWRWGEELERNRAWVSVHPDAHDCAGLSDTHFGVATARKALTPTSRVVNAMGLAEVTRWLNAKKSVRS
jgi:DNA polymerase (family 10)